MSNSITTLYSNLLEKLNTGNKTVIKSIYSDSEISKSIICEDNAEEWVQIQELCSNENTVNDGPVSYLELNNKITLVEKYTPKPRVIILGGGHIALPISQIAKLADFDVLVFDDRPMFANNERFPEADEVICDDFKRLFERVKIRKNDYVVIVTRGHKHDQDCLEGVLKSEKPAYTGMIGSKRRVAIVMKQLEEAGYSKERLDDVYTPIGLNIGAVTPAEIAVCIVAELIQVKRMSDEGADNISCDIEIAELLAEKGDSADALITILSTTGSVPRETGAKMSMTYEGSIMGTIGGGCAESEIMQGTRTIIREGGWKIETIDMTDTAEEDGMVCGGHMNVMIESVNSISLEI